MIPKPGIYYDISFDEYKSWEAVNNSTLKVIATKSPAHCKHYMEHGREDTPALKFGRAADCFILEPTRFFSQYAIVPKCDKRTKEGKDVWAKFCSETPPEKEMITEEEYQEIQEISLAVIDSSATRLITGGQSQVCMVWIDEPTGLTCKMRADYVCPQVPMITDLKTTQDASIESFSRDVFKYGYHQQAGFYCMGYEVLTGEAPQFAIFAIEKEAPYVHSAFELGDRTLMAGRNQARQALNLYAECVKNDSWPMYVEKITMIEIPVWALEKLGVHDYNLL